MNHQPMTRVEVVEPWEVAGPQHHHLYRFDFLLREELSMATGSEFLPADDWQVGSPPGIAMLFMAN